MKKDRYIIGAKVIGVEDNCIVLTKKRIGTNYSDLLFWFYKDNFEVSTAVQTNDIENKDKQWDEQYLKFKDLATSRFKSRR